MASKPQRLTIFKVDFQKRLVMASYGEGMHGDNIGTPFGVGNDEVAEALQGLMREKKAPFVASCEVRYNRDLRFSSRRHPREIISILKE